MNDLTDKGIGKALFDGRTLFSYLGSFWHHVYEDPEFIERFCEALGILSAQLEQRKNEAKAASGRKELPVYSRERWLCVRLAAESRNLCDATKVELSKTAPVIGPQPYGGSYVADSTPVVGPGVPVSRRVFYPLPKNIVSASSVHERVFDPEISFLPDSDFKIADGAISFPADKDPISDSRFREPLDGKGVVVWLRDAMIDNNLVSDYAGYAMGMRLPSTYHNLDTINSFWDIVNSGATVSGAKKFICSALGVSVDSGAVSVSGAGDVLEWSGALFLPKGFFSDGLKFGLGFPDEDVHIVCESNADTENPELKFKLFGSQGDIDAFFKGCHERCRAAGTSMANLLGVEVPVAAGPGEDLPETINPRRFMIDNLVGTNTLFVRINMSLLDDAGLESLGLLYRLLDVSPIGVCVVFCLSFDEIREQYDCQDTSDAVIVSSEIPDLEIEHGPEVSESVEVFMLPGREE